MARMSAARARRLLGIQPSDAGVTNARVATICNTQTNANELGHWQLQPEGDTFPASGFAASRLQETFAAATTKTRIGFMQLKTMCLHVVFARVCFALAAAARVTDSHKSQEEAYPSKPIQFRELENKERWDALAPEWEAAQLR